MGSEPYINGVSPNWFPESLNYFAFNSRKRVFRKKTCTQCIMSFTKDVPGWLLRAVACSCRASNYFLSFIWTSDADNIVMQY